MKRSFLKRKGTSETAKLKDEIQAVVREIVILRDGGCILRPYRHCGGDLGSGAVIQADHLISRSNSATYADSRLVVCVCRPCHAWKSLGSNLRKNEYDDLVKKILLPERVRLWERCEKESWRPSPKGKYDWKLSLIALNQELKKLQEGLVSDY